MLLKRYTFYFLFSLAYIGFLVLEKPYFSVNDSWLSYLPTFIVHFSLMVFMVVVNNRFLIPYLLEKRRFGWYITSLLFLVALFTFVRSAYHRYIYEALYHERSNNVGADIGNSFVYADWFIVVASMLYITQRWSEQRDRVKNIEISQLQTELRYLRSQINPHFLFNGLNTIYSRIDINNRDARDIVVQFADLLRYNLYEADVDLIALEKEIEFLENYVGLQRARSNDNLRVLLDVNIQNRALQIAPLIFLAFIENAFKHVSREDNVQNSITIRLSEEAGGIDFVCDNSFEETVSSTTGIGINNTVRRLDLLYKGRYELDLKKGLDMYHVHLTLKV
jgi:two-component system LytT family sensor kinase